ncbi:MULTISPECIES: hemolysin family protein [unclassified Mesorhizobium]|uniref:hemolysin family protein n=1 Tax=unclassified Mesorhizobium TaxID=325217 RepID=UPI000FD445FA|nr:MULTISPECIES: hemolysin family protein [unclassified Mesorhizobium]RUX09442.1 HlyC/CorC family transporter [Mesorhizobium sp. M8A.F.Ca.ET.059.01.1.1]TGR38320.1 HlyC/CorC family transporter [bacterium M00.F.Ca.ET.199.01.1.1]TGU26605.1 HlyC/CorC family transporter [bacterium M00.F.Ca.ET.156.01.1.1]TGV11764.1 HlyC/CorC family transporter [Mesorhizobium sp. M8A.F.Ca.ET.173.01.1.1]TGV83322.1 HlyC/CorC family transporter [Mesorhizobium sp. M00.F.Ca.ET.149.01.1.1]
MNDKPETAARPDAGSATKASDTSEEGSSPSTIAGSAVVEPSPAGPSLFNRVLGLFRQRNGTSLREEIAGALAETTSDVESFSPGERAMLNNILRLREVRVEDVMVPRADIEAVEIATTLGDLLGMFEQSGHSRMPVYSETLDDPRGMVHIRDVLAHITKLARVRKGRTSRKTPVATVLDLAQVDLARTIGELNLIRQVLFVPPSMLASDLMGRMQTTRTQMALVIDEYGGTDGLVSLEDIVEMVVGDIEDEHDDDEPMITQTGDGVFIVDGKAEIDEVAKMIGEDFAAGEHGEYVDTIGGMIFNTLGRVPARGEVVQAIPGFEFHVLDADPRRVKRVRIVQSQKGERRRRATARTEQA